jgi:hypothetical protein
MIMPPPLREFKLAVHLTVSVGWTGAVAGYIALDVAAATGQDPGTLRVAYLGMDRIARYVIVPLALASLVTGLVVSLWTKWGLFRHYWVLQSFDRLEGHLGRMELSLGRAEWSSRLLDRELRKTR